MTGAELKRRREALGVPVTTLAMQMQVSASQIRIWEASPSVLPLAVAIRLESILAVAWLNRHIMRLPAPLRPAVWGALIVDGLVLTRVLAKLVTTPTASSQVTISSVMIALGVGVYCGAAGGIVYYVVRPPSRRLGRVGDYVTGIAVVYGYLLAFAVPSIVFDIVPEFRGPRGWLAMVAVGTFFGLLMGHFKFREQTTRRS